jgi:ABC-type glycerol-3-phosphate transport system substrate-binding protein
MIPTRILGFFALFAAIVALAACGGGSDKEKAEQTVRDIASATNDSDGDKFCDLVTTQFLEQTTGAKGDKAKDACKKQIDSLKNPDLKVAKISKTEINGDKATVTAVLETSGQKRPQIFNLQKEDGDYKLASGNRQ